MLRFKHVLALCVVIIAIAWISSDGAEQSSDDAGFVSVFNGHDLTGWSYGRWGDVANKVNKGYAAKDGVLYCTATDGGDLFLDKEYSDFDFRFEFKLTKAANNGVGIRAPAKGDSAYTGMEIQVLDDDDPAYKDLRAVQYCGSIYDVVAAKRGHLKPVGEWNSEEIKAVGPHITIRLNDAKIVDANLDQIQDPHILRFHGGLHRKSGRIGFLWHWSRVDFRNLRMKDLSEKSEKH